MAFLVGRALFYEQAKVANEVRVGKADGLLALGRGAHAGDDEVNLAVVERVDKAREALLDGNGLAAESLADDLGDLHVVAIGIGALHVVDGDRELAGLGNLPVIRGVGRLHADADLILADNGIGQVIATAARRGLNYFQRGGTLAAGKCAGDDRSARSESATPKRCDGCIPAVDARRAVVEIASGAFPISFLLTIRQDIRPRPAARHVREKLIDTRGRLAQSSLPHVPLGMKKGKA